MSIVKPNSIPLMKTRRYSFLYFTLGFRKTDNVLKYISNNFHLFMRIKLNKNRFYIRLWVVEVLRHRFSY